MGFGIDTKVVSFEEMSDEGEEIAAAIADNKVVPMSKSATADGTTTTDAAAAVAEEGK